MPPQRLQVRGKTLATSGSCEDLSRSEIRRSLSSVIRQRPAVTACRDRPVAESTSDSLLFFPFDEAENRQSGGKTQRNRQGSRKHFAGIRNQGN